MLIYEAGFWVPNSLEEMLARLSVMQTDYHHALELLNREISVKNQIEMINHLKSERLNQRLLQAVKK
jgi:hypothetical protein